MRVLNVGGGSSRDLPPTYHGWQQDLLDIDPAVKPDIVCDARKLSGSLSGKYDAVFCSHNLEHFHAHEVPDVLGGFHRVLKATGFAQIAVPDIQALFEAVKGRDINDEWYRCPSGPISFHDVLYGWGKQIGQGNLYYCHKTGFTESSITKALRRARFSVIHTAQDGFNLHAFAFKARPKPNQLRTLGL